MNSLHTFLIEPSQLPNAVVGTQFSLPPDEAHHALVRRIAVGEEVVIADGVGRVLRATCVRASGSGRGGEFVVQIDDVHHQPPPAVPLYLVQALAKNGRDEQAIESATELGVMAALPWQADRSIVQWKGAKEAKSLQRWHQIVRAAAKQSRRAWVPQIGEHVLTSKALAGSINEWVAGGNVVLVLDGAGQRLNLGRTENAQPGAREAGIYIIVGPEGGITQQEISLFVAAGAQHVKLGEHTMRASTAGPAAIAVLNQLTGAY